MRQSRSGNNGGGSRNKPTLEIIPDTRFIVFHGNEHEAEPVKLCGIVRLTMPDSMSIQKPKVRLEGKRKISFWDPDHIQDTKIFWTEEKNLGSIESTHKVKAGVIEWPFEFDMSPSVPESVEGIYDTFLTWRICAIVSRPGWGAKDVTAQEHIRVVRTLGPDSMEMTRSRENADIWSNKISYSITIPTDLYVFGTSITADVELTPIKKGLEFGKIDLRLIETVIKRIQRDVMPDSRADRNQSRDRDVVKEEMDFPNNAKVVYDHNSLDNPMMADEKYHFKVTLPLPKSLNQCRQDVDSHQIHISHKFKICINLLNPEGHTSQLVCRLPVKLFISPNLPVGESNEVERPTNGGLTDENLNGMTEQILAVPPEYGRHQLDEFFSDVDPATYATRPPSASESLSGNSIRSRSSSDAEGGGSNGDINAIPNGAALEQHGSAPPIALQSRLANLQQENGAARLRSGGPSAPNSPPEQLSRRGSDEQRSAEVRQSDYNLEDLSRVPSYGHALRTSGAITPLTNVPPTYIEATSRPSSRVPSPHQRPAQVHFRGGIITPNGSANQPALSNGITNLDLNAQDPTLRPPPQLHHEDRASLDEGRVRGLRTGV